MNVPFRMPHPLEELREAALREIAEVHDESALDAVRVRYLGRSGSISAWSEQMKSLGKEEKPVVGKLLNEARTRPLPRFKRGEISTRRKSGCAGQDRHLAPGTATEHGALHPLSKCSTAPSEFSGEWGSRSPTGRTLKRVALFRCAQHRARSSGAQRAGHILFARWPLVRTHTSTVQIRTMQAEPPPIRIIAPGAAYRRDEVDATHSAQFHQIEGLYVDENVSVADLKGTLEFFLRELFGADTAVRFRPHYFPFTEPSFEIDVKSKALKRRRTMDRGLRLRHGASGGLRGSESGARRRGL